MNDRARFGPEWALQIEHSFQRQVLAATRGTWTRARIDAAVRQGELTARWEGEGLCMVSLPDASSGYVMLRPGAPVTDEDEAAIAGLRAAE